MRNGKLLEKCKALGSLTLQKDVLEIKIKALREEISQVLKAGDTLNFEVNNQLFHIINRLEDKAILRSNLNLFKILGRSNFIEVAKISKTEVEKAFGKALVAVCIDHFETSEKLVLTKSKK